MGLGKQSLSMSSPFMGRRGGRLTMLVDIFVVEETSWFMGCHNCVS